MGADWSAGHQVGFVSGQRCPQAPAGLLCALVPETEFHSHVPTAWQCRRTDRHQGTLPLPSLLPPQMPEEMNSPQASQEPTVEFLHAPQPPNTPGGKTTHPYLIQPQTAQQDHGSGSSEHENSSVAQPSEQPINERPRVQQST